MKLFIFPVLFCALSPVVGDVHIDYLVARVPLAEWLDLNHVQTVEECAIDCGEACNNMFDRDHSCNAIIFDESNDVCTRAFYGQPSGTGIKKTGLRLAWASTVFSNNPRFNEEKAIDGDSKTYFHSKHAVNEKYPWLAIDLVWPEKVTKVKMISARYTLTAVEERTHDIEVRVGNDKPFKKNIKGKGDTLCRANPVCGVFKGPAEPEEEFSVTCSAPLIGRYVTLQKNVQQKAGSAINFSEVIIESSPDDTKIEILLRQEPYPGQCPEDHPYSYNYGQGCCSKGKGSSSFYDKTCLGTTGSCFGASCLPYQYKP